MNNNDWTSSTVSSADGTTIAYETIGTGAGFIVVGGVLSTTGDYMDLARQLAGSFTVHLMERRGRGASGPQGPGYSIDKECEDLLAVRADTGAERVFGHSYGGFVALHTTRRAAVFRQVAVYEPAVMLDGSPPPAWLDPYRELLAHGDKRGAFATMVKHAGFAPRALAAMPLAVVRLVLRARIRGHEWQRTGALLEANLAEQQAQLDAAGIAGYAEIESPTLLIGGSNSPPSVTAQLGALRHTIPTTTVTILHGLNHPAPQTHPAQVANCIERFFAPTPSDRNPVDAARHPANHAIQEPRGLSP
jgi:pimeloyl-ACP methyl ester carboxylesterase